MIQDNMTFIDLLRQFTIEIPLVQRDYAQGRTGSHETSVRTTLLKDIKDALLNNTLPLDLNFVYGKLSNAPAGGKQLFIPMDGQQRLTTLLLLHVYAFRNDDSMTDILLGFKYRTRKTSERFLEKLIENRASVFGQGRSCKDEILDKEWFNWEWEHDPTVLSCLEMLATIEQNEYFGQIPNLDKLLTDASTKCRVSFSYLDMNDFGMDDTLYIKLNSRGRALTSLENFKAKLLNKIKNLSKEDQAKLPQNDSLGVFVEKFSGMFDGAWSRWFWKHDKKQFDNCYMALFGAIFRNYRIIEEDDGWAADRNNGTKKNQDYWSNKDINNLSIGLEHIVIIYNTLNALTSVVKTVEEQAIQAEFDGIVKSVVREDRSFADRLRLHALTQYLTRSCKMDEAMRQWLRVCKNLIVNIDISSKPAYVSGLNCINEMLPSCQNILDYLVNGGKVSSFTDQVAEERLKAKLILNDKAFESIIYDAEKAPYFSGRISGAFRLAYDGAGGFDKTRFVQYWNQITSLFDLKEPRGDCENTLRRALLAIGNYPELCRSGKNRYLTLCVDDPLETNDTRSFKYLFSTPLTADEVNGVKPVAKYDIVQTFLDRFDPGLSLNAALQSIIASFAPTVDKRDWRYCFVHYPELLDRQTTKFRGGIFRLRYNDNGDFLVVPYKETNGANYNVFLLVVEALLKRKGISEVDFDGENGLNGDRYLVCNNKRIRYIKGNFTIRDENESLLYTTSSNDPYTEVIGRI